MESLNNQRYADDTTVLADESQEDLKFRKSGWIGTPTKKVLLRVLMVPYTSLWTLETAAGLNSKSSSLP